MCWGGVPAGGQSQFGVNMAQGKTVVVFRKLAGCGKGGKGGVIELGKFRVTGFVPIRPGDDPAFGPTFVRFERAAEAESDQLMTLTTAGSVPGTVRDGGKRQDPVPLDTATRIWPSQ